MLCQGADKEHIAPGPVASRSLTDVPEVFWGDTSALLQQRALPWPGVPAARRGASSGAVLSGTRVGPTGPWHRPNSCGKAGGRLGGGPRGLLLPWGGKRGEQASVFLVEFCLCDLQSVRGTGWRAAAAETWSRGGTGWGVVETTPSQEVP